MGGRVYGFGLRFKDVGREETSTMVPGFRA